MSILINVLVVEYSEGTFVISLGRYWISLPVSLMKSDADPSGLALGPALSPTRINPVALSGVTVSTILLLPSFNVPTDKGVW